MKFMINRVSGNTPPSKNSFQEEDGEDGEYYVEINTLEELLELMNDEGELVLREDGSGENNHWIQIYDDYLD